MSSDRRIKIDFKIEHQAKTITSIAEELGIHRDTLYQYKRLAEYIFDFEQDYPQCNGEPIKGSGLTEYQTWVITALISYRRIRGLKFSSLKTLLADTSNHQLFSFNGYLLYLKGGWESDNTESICK